MSAHSASEAWVNRSTLAWLFVAQGVAILPLFIYLPLWIVGIWLTALVWRIQIYRGAWPFPSSRIKGLLGALSIVALLVTYAGSIGVEPLVAFLLASFILKLLEVRSRNDVLVIVYVGFIAVAAQFLFFQTIFIALYAVISVVLLVCAWSCIYRSTTVSVRKQLWFGGSLILQSLPLMAVLFVVLPRVSALWYVPIPQKTGQTGFSESMSPGDLSSLSKSKEVAFRVTFKGPHPPKKNWYWRGLVLDLFDGRRWHFKDSTRSTNASNRSRKNLPDFWQMTIPDRAVSYRYQVLMEPHQHRWLFSLMTPVTAQSSANRLSFTSNYLIKSRKPLASRTHYDVVSMLDYSASPDSLTDWQWRKNLSVPSGSNPKTRAFVKDWVEEGLEPKEIVQKALGLYRESFSYTLRPPPLGTHSVDEFLFITRKGFCEHFASSFVVMMRNAGIPARVVVGYQGGEFNPLENYIIVRQSDAHAWAEVWIAGEGWVRIDPTAAVSPSRIERGLEDSLEEADKQLLTSFFSGALFGALQLRLDALSYSWHQWVLSYDESTQKSVFQRLFGGADPWRVGLAFVVCVISLLGVYFLYLTYQGRVIYRYPEQRVLSKLLKKLKKRGLEPLPNETVAVFCRRVAGEQKGWEKDLEAIGSLYEKIAFAEQPHLLEALKKRVNAFQVNI